MFFYAFILTGACTLLSSKYLAVRAHVPSIEGESESYHHYKYNKNEKESPHKWYVENSRGDIKRMEYLPPHWKSAYATTNGDQSISKGQDEKGNISTERKVGLAGLNPDLQLKYVSPIPYHLYAWNEDNLNKKEGQEELNIKSSSSNDIKSTHETIKEKDRLGRPLKNKVQRKRKRSKKQKEYNGLWSWNQMKKQKAYYQTITPNITQGPIVQSACSGGEGYACPHMMMFSDEMIKASKYDGLYKDFVYATAGTSSDYHCGECHQIKIIEANREHRDDFKLLIVQSINQGGDVAEGQFDLFMAAGGFGWYNSCSRDCKQHACGGGNGCSRGMYNSEFLKWNSEGAGYGGNACYSGGLKWEHEQSEQEIQQMCKQLHNNTNHHELKNKFLYQSCHRTNVERYHQNFNKIESLRVRCPAGLYKLTGHRREDDENYPLPHVDNQYTTQCNNPRGHSCISTMQDCCKPSCSWPNKGGATKEYNRVYTCNYDGYIM